MAASEVLRRNKEKILKQWEELSLAKLPEAEKLSYVALRDHMPAIFDRLCDALESGVLNRPDRASKTHGRERGCTLNYSLLEVMTEYSILKNLIYDELTLAHSITLGEIRLIDKFFDTASSTAVIEFFAQKRGPVT